MVHLVGRRLQIPRSRGGQSPSVFGSEVLVVVARLERPRSLNVRSLTKETLPVNSGSHEGDCEGYRGCFAGAPLAPSSSSGSSSSARTVHRGKEDWRPSKSVTGAEWRSFTFVYSVE